MYENGDITGEYKLRVNLWVMGITSKSRPETFRSELCDRELFAYLYVMKLSIDEASKAMIVCLKEAKLVE